MKDAVLNAEEDVEVTTKYGSMSFQSLDELMLEAKEDITIDTFKFNFRNLPVVNEVSDEILDSKIAAQVICL